jgi:hypothetical protein
MSSGSWQSLGVNQSPGSGTDYPFSAPSADVKYLLGDLWFAYDDDACQFVLPLSVKWMYGFGWTDPVNPLPMYTPRHALDMVIVDANGTVVFDTTQSGVTFGSNLWGNNLQTLQWTNGDTVLRATRHLLPPPWDPTHVRNTFIVPVNGELDARTYVRLPKRVKSFWVGLTQISAGNLVLAEGYNTSLTPQAPVVVDGGHRTTQINMRFRGGDGLGRLPGCTDTQQVIRRINTIPPTSGGDFVIDASGCYWTGRPNTITSASPPRETSLGGSAFTTLLDSTIAAMPDAFVAPGVKTYYADNAAAVAQATLQVNNDCGPCCDCDEFLRVYEGIRRLDARYRSIATQAEQARDTFQSNISRWDAQAACRSFQNLRLVLDPERNCGLFVAGVHCNNVQCCTAPLVLRTTFEAFSGGSPVSLASSFAIKCHESKRAGADTRYQEVDYNPLVNWPVMDTVFDYADPQGTSRFRNRLKFVGCPADVVRVTLSLHAQASTNRVTGAGCPLPDPSAVSVPSSVQTIWNAIPPLYPVRSITQMTVPVSMTAGCGGCT